MFNQETTNKAQETAINRIIVKSQQLLNIVAQDSTVCASLLVEDTGFYNLLCEVASSTMDDETAYNALMSYINENF